MMAIKFEDNRVTDDFNKYFDIQYEYMEYNFA